MGRIVEARQIYQKHLKLSEENIPFVDFVFCLVLAPQLKELVELTWGFAAGAAGSGKSTIVNTLLALDDKFIYPLDTLTEKSLMSAWVADPQDGQDRVGENALIHKLKNKLVLVEDMSNFSSLREEEGQATNSMIRTLYKGRAKRATGYGDFEVEARVGFLFVTVPTIDAYLIRYQQLGPRFLVFRWYTPRSHRRSAIKQALRAHASSEKWLSDLNAFVAETMNPVLLAARNISAADFLLPLSDTQENTIIALAEIVSLSRMLPMSLVGKTNIKIETNPHPEVGTRLSKQFHSLACERAYLDGRTFINDEDMELVARIAWDCLPAICRRLFSAMRRGNEKNQDQIVNWTGDTHDVVSTVLTQFRSAGLVIKTGPKKWKLHSETQKEMSAIWNRYEWWPLTCYNQQMELN